MLLIPMTLFPVGLMYLGFKYLQNTDKFEPKPKKKKKKEK